MGRGENAEDKRAQDLQTSVAMTEFDALVPTTANGNEQRAPEAAMDALIEAAWGFPGYRVSFAAFDGPRALRFCTSAGEEQMRQLDGFRIDLTRAPRLLEALRVTRVPLAIEDVSTDSRARPITTAFESIEARAVLILPLWRDRDRQPFGVVMMDCEKPRTWGLKEGAALDRLAPIIALSLQHVQIAAELESTRASAADHERRVRAMQGMVAAFASDAHRLTSALLQTVGHSDAGAASLADQLARLIDELDGVQHGPLIAAPARVLSLPEMVKELANGLQLLTGLKIKTPVQDSASSLSACAHRTGLERLITKLVLHACHDAPSDAELIFEVRVGDDGLPSILLHGDAIKIDEALSRAGSGHDVHAAEQLDPSLWQARSEALIQGAAIEVGESTIAIRLPAAAECEQRNAGAV